MPPKPGNSVKSKPAKGKGKGRQKKQRRHRLNLKGWLKTAADWARFDGWAKVNALPKKVPEPEPIVRVAKPLSQLKKRLLVISQPAPKSDPGLLCRLDLSVSKAALKAKPSKRIKELAMFVWKDEDPGKEMPNPITKAALNYKATPRIIEMAVPHVHETESCRDLAISKKALKHKTTKREKMMSLAKKARDCSNSLNEEEFARLFTPTGIKKSALTYKITEWVSTLALPSYRFLKDRRDQEAQKMKKMIEASDDRGKKVLEEQRKQEEEKERKKKEKGKKGMKKKESKKGETANGKKGTEEKPDEEDQEKEKKEEKQKKEEERKSKERKKWRKEPGPCKDNYGSVSKAALNAKASERTEEIAKPHIHVSTACRNDAFGVKKSALSASASARVSEMAQPNHPADPVERPPPREKNAFGAPIFPQPKFGKRLPKVKPYKMGECKDKDNKDKGQANELENTMKKYESVPLYPSIDPCIDPAGAKKQAKARRVAEKAKKARREKRRQKRQAKSDQVKPENDEKK